MVQHPPAQGRHLAMRYRLHEQGQKGQRSPKWIKIVGENSTLILEDKHFTYMHPGTSFRYTFFKISYVFYNGDHFVTAFTALFLP